MYPNDYIPGYASFRRPTVEDFSLLDQSRVPPELQD